MSSRYAFHHHGNSLDLTYSLSLLLHLAEATRMLRTKVVEAKQCAAPAMHIHAVLSIFNAACNQCMQPKLL